MATKNSLLKNGWGINMLNQVVTVQEAAEITKSNVRQVQRLCEKGKYKCRKAKGTWLILRSSL